MGDVDEGIRGCGGMENSRADAFRRLLEKSPGNSMILYSLGNELFKEGRHAEAAAYLREAVEAKPDYSVAYRTLGRALHGAGEPDGARRAFERGREVARANGDLQTIKEIDVFQRRLEKQSPGGGPGE